MVFGEMLEKSYITCNKLCKKILQNPTLFIKKLLEPIIEIEFRRNRIVIYLFEKQLIMAENLNLPVVIHSRDAVNDTIENLKKHNVKGVIHCFSGSVETADIYIRLGYKLGIGGVVTFKNSNLSISSVNIILDNSKASSIYKLV